MDRANPSLSLERVRILTDGDDAAGDDGLDVERLRTAR